LGQLSAIKRVYAREKLLVEIASASIEERRTGADMFTCRKPSHRSHRYANSSIEAGANEKYPLFNFWLIFLSPAIYLGMID